MFRRRVELHPLEKLREALWPRIGWKRAAQYVWRRVWRLSGTPHTIAIGVAAGTFVSFTPFLGFHIIIAVVITWVLRGNLLAAVFGTLAGNPLSYPPIWFATFDLGSRLLGMSTGHHVNLSEVLMNQKAFDMILPVLVPMALGSVPLGLAAALVAYFLVKTGVAAYQLRRREQIEARVLARRAGPDAELDDDEQE